MEQLIIKEVTITRILNAPRELVFKTWTEPEHLAQWWGPRGFTAPTCEVDLRPGGKLRIHMDHPDFPNHWMTGEFSEIKAPERLVFTSRAFIDESGYAGIEGINTVTFEDINGKTKLTVHAALTHLSPEHKFAADGMNEGWKQSIDKLEEYINRVNQ